MNENRNLQIPFPEWAARAIIWATTRYSNGVRGVPLALSAFFGPFVEKYYGVNLEDGLEHVIREQQDKVEQHYQSEIDSAIVPPARGRVNRR